VSEAYVERISILNRKYIISSPHSICLLIYCPRTGFYRYQNRFLRFLYRLSSTHYNWGRRDRRRYEDDRSNDEKKWYVYVKYICTFHIFL